MVTFFVVTVVMILVTGIAFWFLNNAQKFIYIILSRPITAILMALIWLTFPDYNRIWIDSYEDRDGYHDVYETTFTDNPSRFEKLFNNGSDIAYAVLNSFTIVFICYLFYILNRAVRPFEISKLQIDMVGMLFFAGLFLFNPIDPIISYLSPSWQLSVKGFYLICFGIWFIFFNDVKRRFKALHRNLSEKPN